MIATLTHDNLNSPVLESLGLSLRQWRDDSDFEKMSRVLIASRNADGVDEARTGDDLRKMYSRTKNFEAARNLFLVEQDDELVGYAGCRWWEERDANFIHSHWIFALPEWRGRGIENELLRVVQERLRFLANEHSKDATNWLEMFTYESQMWMSGILLADGYEPARYSFDMVRENLENIPDAELPAGIETRPVKPEDMRKVFDAADEAFADDWSSALVEDGDFELWLKDFWKPELWQIAWDGDQVVGHVLNYVSESENKQYGRKRGYTEDIGVRKPWRRRGVAKALLVKSLKMFREMGYDSTALGVDTQNPNSALRLYESVGYKTVRTETFCRKRM